MVFVTILYHCFTDQSQKRAMRRVCTNVITVRGVRHAATNSWSKYFKKMREKFEIDVNVQRFHDFLNLIYLK